jgi:hypothetical protein
MNRGCRDKVSHATPEAARESLHNLLKANLEHPSRAKLLNVYGPCAFCRGYHVGHNKKGKPTRRGKHRRRRRES